MVSANPLNIYPNPTRNQMVIHTEHLQFKRHLERIRETCLNIDKPGNCKMCDREKLASCRGRLASLQIYGIEIAEKYFTHSENVLLNQQESPVRHSQLKTYRAAHEALIEKLELINHHSTKLKNSQNTVDAYRNLYYQTAAVLKAHERLFKTPVQSQVVSAA
jgi:hypothetical protein